MRALLVEDDPRLGEFVARALCEASYAVDRADNGEEGLRLALDREYAVAIIDVMLPKRDGLSLIEELRKRGSGLPVLILSARRSVDERVEGLRRGGDDYLVKPFAIPELLARVEALSRRVRPADETHPATLSAGGLSLDRLSRRATREGRDIELNPREFSLLELLLRRPGRVVTKAMILDGVWSYDFDPGTSAVDVLVHRLRRKIDEGFSKPLLRTIRGVGYVLGP